MAHSISHEYSSTVLAFESLVDLSAFDTSPLDDGAVAFVSAAVNRFYYYRSQKATPENSPTILGTANALAASPTGPGRWFRIA